MSQPVILDRRSVLQSIFMIIFMILVAGGMGAWVLSDEAFRSAFVLNRAARVIDAVYLEAPDREALAQAAREAMMARLDRFSGYVTREGFDRLQEEQSGSYSGIGVTIVERDSGLLITVSHPEGPAHEAGMRAGDLIVQVDSTELKDLEWTEATLALRGEEGSSVTLRAIRRPLRDTLEFDVVRGQVPLVHVEYAGYTSDSMVYIRLADFEPGATDDVRAALDSLAYSGGQVVARGVILDLKGNPGGLFSEAYRCADLFLDEGTFIVGTDGRSRWNDEEYYSTDQDLTRGLPLAILVDGRSASSAEILSGALQQAGRAILIGDTTYGKGLVQGYLRLQERDGLRLTISRYFLDGGVYLNEFDSTLVDTGHGLVPDSLCEFVEDGEFPQALERSLLAYEFAAIYHDEIVADAGDGLPGSEWLDIFYDFAREEGFSFVSERTRLTRDMAKWSERNGYDASIQAAVERLTQLSDEGDLRAIYSHGEFVRARVLELAIQRDSSQWKAYRQVVVPRRPDIELAARLLIGNEGPEDDGE